MKKTILLIALGVGALTLSLSLTFGDFFCTSEKADLLFEGIRPGDHEKGVREFAASHGVGFSIFDLEEAHNAEVLLAGSQLQKHQISLVLWAEIKTCQDLFDTEYVDVLVFFNHDRVVVFKTRKTKHLGL
jgi:hypothetical protein